MSSAPHLKNRRKAIYFAGMKSGCDSEPVRQFKH
jgi:hypothetical protein